MKILLRQIKTHLLPCLQIEQFTMTAELWEIWREREFHRIQQFRETNILCGYAQVIASKVMKHNKKKISSTLKRL